MIRIQVVAIGLLSLAFLFKVVPAHSSGVQKEGHEPEREPLSVTFCELVKSPDRYNKTVVRTQAILLEGPEHSVLYDPECINHSNLTWVEWAAYSQALTAAQKSVRKKLKSYLKSQDRARITVVGTFDARPEVAAPKNLSPEVAEAVRRNNEQAGFGHLGCCPHQLAPITIEAVNRVPKSTPLP